MYGVFLYYYTSFYFIFKMGCLLNLELSDPMLFHQALDTLLFVPLSAEMTDVGCRVWLSTLVQGIQTQVLMQCNKHLSYEPSL